MSEPIVEQLSFTVVAHPAAAARADGGWLEGSVSVGGAFSVGRDLQQGDELTNMIASADGEVIAGGIVEVQTVSFKPIKVKGFVVGAERVHKAELR